MPARRAKSAPKTPPWWLSGGEELCVYCGQLYVYELEFRCPDCDEPSCPHCRTMHPEGRHVCPSCVSCLQDQEQRHD